MQTISLISSRHSHCQRQQIKAKINIYFWSEKMQIFHNYSFSIADITSCNYLCCHFNWHDNKMYFLIKIHIKGVIKWFYFNK